MNSQTVTNFGKNLSFSPKHVFTPKTESEVLSVLEECRGRRIRTIGRLHSWSEAPVTNDVLIDLRHLNQVTVEERDGRVWGTVGAGCQIKRLLSELERQGGNTLPSVGLITEQTIAGVISTGTHGSGKNSLSHYMDEIRVAVYDPVTGEPVIRTISADAKLQAARCSLGSLGVIVLVGFWCRPQYHVEEHFHRYDTLEQVVDAETDYPLQQFYLIPWHWKYFAQHRREVDAKRSRLATLYRWYFYLVIDVAFHLIVSLFARWLPSRRCLKFFFRHIAPRTVVKDWKVVDKSQDMLVMEHELLRHIEIEIFVKRARLSDTIAFVTELLKHFDGDARETRVPWPVG
jgi:FAD/FMN-containing dehydrogenase